MPRLPLALLTAALIALFAPRVQADAPLTDRERELMGIAASCAAFYQAAMFELDLPVEGNEDKRQAYLSVLNELAGRGRSAKELEAHYQRAVVQRFSEVATLIQLDRTNVAPKVTANLPKCDAYLTEMKTAAGLE
jgi:hypothetical protein